MKKLLLSLFLLVGLFSKSEVVVGSTTVMIAGQVVGAGCFAVVANDNNVPFVLFYAPLKNTNEEFEVLFKTYFNTQSSVDQLLDMLTSYARQVKILKMRETCTASVYNLDCPNDLGWSVGTFSSDDCFYRMGIYVTVEGLDYIVSIPDEDLIAMYKEVKRIYDL